MKTTNNSTIPDAKERLRAIDPTQSFIVQAPAGSGKTELLTQRYLVLLSHVKLPEEILAITFTKKSAAEMRARIIKALKSACYDPEPLSEHEKHTWNLAKKAFQKNVELNWNLLENPNRLQIQTIDSFNASLTRQLPLLSNFGAPLEIIDDASPLYREAVQEFLTHLEEDFTWASAIEKLLIHMDNDLASVETLLINMLAKRDQWLPYIATNANNPELRKTLEAHLSHVVIDTLTALHDSFPYEYAHDLIELIQFAAQNLLGAQSDSIITECAELTELPGITIQDKKCWLGIASLLLTKNKPFAWRKSFTITDGFPAPSSTKNQADKEYLTQIKLRLKNLMEALSEHDELHQALKDLINLPDYQYEDKQWETLNALHDVLRVVVAQLKLVFQEHGKIDYIENAQAALTALGTEDAPTDITLALDYKIQHILIDEFQDTSNSQYRLLEKLIAGWQAFDGRSLFVVGDPMQSIYRFREAEVGLFIRARKQGIRDLYLEPLTLSVNFRSEPTIVSWVNEKFQQVLPPFEDIASGAVSYSASTSCKNTDEPTGSVMLHPVIDGNEDDQANEIVRTIQAIKEKESGEKIAILVRSRSHLKAIIPALKAAKIAFRALDIEPLSTRPVIQDLLALTRALLHPADRIAWLAILRAPWCGLTLSDLLIIAGDKNKHIIWEQLKLASLITQLSEDGQKRLERIFPTLEAALAERRRYTLRQWVEYTWLQLGGPACVEELTDLDDAQAFFNLLDKLDRANDLPDIHRLSEAIDKLYAAPNIEADDFLQIMTIHNSKGLEFDIVILPYLERTTTGDKKQLLQWMERARLDDDSSDLILAPIHAVGEKNNSIYDYIKRQHAVRTDYENGRLLYVAATRAKKELHLYFNLEKNKNNEIANPASHSLLQKLWPAIENNIKSNPAHLNISKTNQDKPSVSVNYLNRLATHWVNPFIENKFTDSSGYHQKSSGFYLPQNNPKYIGIVIHQILQQISIHGINWWTQQSSNKIQAYLKNNLLQLGMKLNDISDAVSIIKKSIDNTLNDKRGQWILYSHTDAKSELPLTILIEEKPKNLIIDRTFIDENNTRWIIDYKSAELGDNNLENFLQAEKKLYQKQLWEYHQALRELDQRTIRVGLYFPLIPAWMEWSFDVAER